MIPREGAVSLSGSPGHREETHETQFRLGYHPELDGLRAIAVAMVMWTHYSGPAHGGFLGVDLFFVLSGFLITTLLLEEWGVAGQISLGRFWMRRILRLYPALVVFLLCFLAAVVVLHPAGLTMKDSVIGSGLGLVYVSNLVLTFTSFQMPGLGHLWSLAMEEQFYLLWPPILVLLLWRRVSRQALMVGLAVAIGVVALARLELFHSLGFGAVQYAPWTRVDVLLVGCLAGVWVTQRGASGSSPLAPGRTSGLVSDIGLLVLFVIVWFTRPYSAWLPLGGWTVFALVAAIVCVGLLQPGSVVGRFLRLPPIVYLGRISYGIYLWHNVAYVVGLHFFGPRFSPGVVRWLSALLAVVFASASYLVVERHFLRLKSRFTVVRDRHEPAEQQL
jgi:peptidoglycan/LPS O-acetylase OafA/YrhL